MNPFKRKPRLSARAQLIIAVTRPLAFLGGYVTVWSLTSILAPPTAFAVGGDLYSHLTLTSASVGVIVAPLIAVGAELIIIHVKRLEHHK